MWLNLHKISSFRKDILVVKRSQYYLIISSIPPGTVSIPNRDFSLLQFKRDRTYRLNGMFQSLIGILADCNHYLPAFQ